MRSTILLISLASCLSASAATYKWVDEHGVTQYGDTLPPQAVNRGMTEMNQKGRVVRTVEPALTPEQIKAQEAELAKQKELAKQNEERRRRDQALLGTYTSEQEIDLARDRNTQQIDSTIRIAQERVATGQAREKDLTVQLGRQQSNNKSDKPRIAAKELTEELEKTKQEQVVLNAAVLELQKQKEQVIARFNEDKVRFREIKQAGAGSPLVNARDQRSDRISVPFPINDSSRALVNECLARWSKAPSGSATAYAASAELVQDKEKKELVLDGRLPIKSGKFTAQRAVCPLTADGKIDPQGIEIKKALSSLGARY